MLSGEMAGYRWRLDAAPFSAAFVNPRTQTRWTPRKDRPDGARTGRRSVELRYGPAGKDRRPMKMRSRRKAPTNRWIAGFTLFEALVSVALMGALSSSLSAVAGQWLPNWHRGFGRVQRLETLDVGLQRLAADLEAAEFVAPSSASKGPFFVGDQKQVMFIRVANAPGTTPHLEFVRIAETVDERGFALVRSHAPFKPLDPNRPLDAQLYFADPVVLIRAPFRVSYALSRAPTGFGGVRGKNLSSCRLRRASRCVTRRPTRFSPCRPHALCTWMFPRNASLKNPFSNALKECARKRQRRAPHRRPRNQPKSTLISGSAP